MTQIGSLEALQPKNKNLYPPLSYSVFVLLGKIFWRGNNEKEFKIYRRKKKPIKSWHWFS